MHPPHLQQCRSAAHLVAVNSIRLSLMPPPAALSISQHIDKSFLQHFPEGFWFVFTVSRTQHNSIVWTVSAACIWSTRASLESALSRADSTSLLDAAAAAMAAATAGAAATTAAGAAAAATAGTTATAGTASSAAAIYSCFHSAGTGHLGENAHGSHGDQDATVL